ncbi:MAG: efflux RND transporter permease subunit [Negativicutes bacterium]|nr:efflux RND transporter permease subunit [Negativicutes bacterium]
MILTDISLKRPVFATVTILALVVLGLFGYISLNVDEYPDVEFPFVTVQVTYPGASPEQVETKITQKVEEAVGSVSGVKHINSTVREGVSITTIEFTLETKAQAAAQDIRDRIGRLRGALPQDADEPVIMRFDPAEAPIASIVITGNMSPREMTTLVNDLVKRRLESIDGVGSVTVQGGLDREIQIDLDSSKIAAYGLTANEIIDSLRSENLELPGGKVTDGNREITMRTAGNLTTTDQFRNLPVARRNGAQLFISNIATVNDTTKDASSITKFNGQPAIGIDIMKQSGANTVKVSDQIKQELDALKQELPAGVEAVMVRDNSKNIRESVHDVLFNLILGGVLAVAIVYLFLGNWRSTLIAAIAIPASIISTFFIMKLLNFTLNTMSLLALSLAVGLLIDDAIVVIENIVRHMELGKSKLEAAADGTAEIGLAVTATTLTLVAVFVPVGMMNGIAGQFFKQFGITVAFSVLVSLFIAFTLTPMLSAKYLTHSHAGDDTRLGRWFMRWNAKFDAWTQRYGDFLSKALSHRGKVLAISGALFLGSLALIPFLGANFVPAADNGEFSVTAEVDPGMSVKAVGELADQIVAIVRTAPEVKMTYAVSTVDNINILVKLPPKNARQRSDTQVMAELRDKLNDIPGVKVSVTRKAGLTGGKPVSIVIRGESLDMLSEIAEQVQRAIETTPGAVDVSSSYKPGKPDAQIQIKRERAADLGVSAGAIADTLRTMFNGAVVTQFKEGNDAYDVRVRLAANDRVNLTDLNNIYLSGKYRDAAGQAVMVPLSEVAQTVYATSPSEIKRYDREVQITLSANLKDVSLGKFNRDLAGKLAQIKLPAGYSIVTTGQSEQMRETFTNIALALLMAVLFIFFVLAAQFESYIDPFSIMLALPLAIIGAILGLLVMRSDLSLMSLIGVIMLMGLVTKNAILLIDFAKQRMQQGTARNQALVEAAVVRMRPIIMTTAAMIFGMLPLALSIGPGAESRAPMAHSIVGGLITSTILTLVVVPVVYTLLDDLKPGMNTAMVKKLKSLLRRGKEEAHHTL